MRHDTKTEKPHNIGRSRLGRHLAVVLILKIVVLSLLWLAFVKPNRVKVDEPGMEQQITGTRQPHMENRHDRLDGR